MPMKLKLYDNPSSINATLTTASAIDIHHSVIYSISFDFTCKIILFDKSSDVHK